MKKLIAVVIALQVASAGQASAWFCPPFIPPIVPPVVASTPSSSGAVGGGVGGSSSSAGTTAVGVGIGIIAIFIIADEVRRTNAGPACATGKRTRQSYFGKVIDEPKLWRPLCNWKVKHRAAVVVKVRG
jgi:hypothetical protein